MISRRNVVDRLSRSDFWTAGKRKEALGDRINTILWISNELNLNGAVLPDVLAACEIKSTEDGFDSAINFIMQLCQKGQISRKQYNLFEEAATSSVELMAETDPDPFLAEKAYNSLCDFIYNDQDPHDVLSQAEIICIKCLIELLEPALHKSMDALS